MLRAIFHSDFKKDYARLRPATKKRFQEKYEIFINNPFDQRLKNHPLKGKLQGRWAFSIESDIRVIYRFITEDMILLLGIGPHSHVYK